jgi:hypothetical protein
MRLALEAAPDLRNPDALMKTGSAFNRFISARKQGHLVEGLLRRVPGLAGRGAEFASSDALRTCPMLAYPALMFAALAVSPNRKARPSDRYDVSHLTKGLSRCDIVTTDRGMAHICRERKLVPSGVKLFSSAELDDLDAHLRSLIPPTSAALTPGGGAR